MNACIYGCIALWIYGCIYGCIYAMDLWMHLWMHCAMVLVRFYDAIISYDSAIEVLHECLCMGASAYQQLFKVNMQQLIRRYASQFARILRWFGGGFFSSPVEVWPYRRDGIAVIVR